MSNHASPNIGGPGAAMAGASADGPGAYLRKKVFKHFIAEARSCFDKKHIENSVKLMYCTTLFNVIEASAIRLLVAVTGSKIRSCVMKKY